MTTEAEEYINRAKDAISKARKELLCALDEEVDGYYDFLPEYIEEIMDSIKALDNIKREL